MEQKTEASQAVDDLDALAKRLDRIHTACTDDRPKQAVGEMIHAMINMPEWNRVRAALKAQPAPTEAQGESPFKFRPWSKEAEMVEGWTAAEKSREAGQGEDSARLDAAHSRLLAAVKIYSHGYMQDEAADEEDCVCGAAQHAEAKEVFAAIAEVERASAETGGVKS